MALGNSRDRMLSNYKTKVREKGQSDVSSRLQGARKSRLKESVKAIKDKTKVSCSIDLLILKQYNYKNNIFYAKNV